MPLPTHPYTLRCRAAALSILLLSLQLGGCAHRSTAGAATNRSDQIGQAAASPLSDFNLMQIDVPPVLLTAKQRPYAPPPLRECAPLLIEVQALDAALGPDLDAPAAPSSDASMTDQGTQVVGDAAVGAFRGAVENLVPFRGWVRRLSGADQHEREVAAAIAAGMVRRAFLKGLMEAKQCLRLEQQPVQVPAQPQPQPAQK